MLWRRRFNSGGLAAVLEDRPRSGRPRQISAEQEAAIVNATMKTTPKEATHGSVRALAASQNSTIQRCR
jgi:putative transposase